MMTCPDVFSPKDLETSSPATSHNGDKKAVQAPPAVAVQVAAEGRQRPALAPIRHDDPSAGDL